MPNAPVNQMKAHQVMRSLIPSPTSNEEVVARLRGEYPNAQLTCSTGTDEGYTQFIAYLNVLDEIDSDGDPIATLSVTTTSRDCDGRYERQDEYVFENGKSKLINSRQHDYTAEAAGY